MPRHDQLSAAVLSQSSGSVSQAEGNSFMNLMKQLPLALIPGMCGLV